jgi:uncharacterized protein YecT (DUF1311 family)
MKRKSTGQIVFCVCLCLTVPGSTAQGAGGSGRQGPKDCLAHATNQLDMNRCAGADADAADRELNRTYQAILRRYADQPLFIERLREAQRAWLKYRDAQIAMKFPISPKPDESAQGSVSPMCLGAYKAGLIRRRTQELREWLVGIAEGDVCAGSIKTHESLR